MKINLNELKEIVNNGKLVIVLLSGFLNLIFLLMVYFGYISTYESQFNNNIDPSHPVNLQQR